MKRALLLNPPGRLRYLRDYFCSTVSKAGYYWHPGDLLLQSGHFAAAGYDVTVLDCIASGIGPEDALAKIRALAPEAILSLVSASSWPEDLPFLERVHRDTGATILASGEIFLDRARPVLEANPFLAGCLFDFTSADPVRFLAGARDVTSMAYREGAEIVVKRVDARGPFEIPVPLHERFPLDRYSMPGVPTRRWASLLTNYGCPFPCDFCNSCTFGFSWREPANVELECQRLRELGIRHVFIKDMTFAAKKAHGLAILDVLERHPFTHHCWCRVDLIDDEVALRMKRAGFLLVQFGVESGSAEILKKHGKRYAPEQVENAFAILAKHGIAAGAHFVLGLPGETPDTVEQTIALASRLPALYASFNVFSPRHGTPLREEAIARGLIDPLATLDSSVMTPMASQAGFTVEELERYRKQAYRRFYLRPGYLASHLARPQTWRNHAVLGLGLMRNLIAN